jgi:hypothetical protein
LIDNILSKRGKAGGNVKKERNDLLGFIKKKEEGQVSMG